MALKVTLNQRFSNKILGTTYEPGASFWDPLTKVKLNAGNLVSPDLSTFTNAQLANISNAVYMGTLALTSGTAGTAAGTPGASAGNILPLHSASFSTYSLYASSALVSSTGQGTYQPTFTAGASGFGITGVAAADALQPKNESF